MGVEAKTVVAARLGRIGRLKAVEPLEKTQGQFFHPNQRS